MSGKKKAAQATAAGSARATPAESAENTLQQNEIEKAVVLRRMIDSAINFSDFLTERQACFAGYVGEAALKAENTKRPYPEPRDYCMALLKHSAKVERDAEAKQSHHEQSLLAPYEDLLEDRNIAVTPAETRKVVDLLFNAVQTSAADKTGKTHIPYEGNTPIIITQAMALDVSFTKIVIDYLDGKTQKPTTTNTLDQVSDLTNACYYNYDQVSNGLCSQAGIIQAVHNINNPELAQITPDVRDKNNATVFTK